MTQGSFNLALRATNIICSEIESENVFGKNKTDVV